MNATYQPHEIMQHTNQGLEIFEFLLNQYYPGLEIIMQGKESLLMPNPFCANRKSLQIYKDRNYYKYRDTITPECRGNPIQFAAAHYGTVNYTLLQEALGTEMRLDLKALAAAPPNEPPGPKVSFFNGPNSNSRPTESIGLLEVYKRITNGYCIDVAMASQPIHDPVNEGTVDLFPFVTFGGVFMKRDPDHLLKALGLMSLQFENVSRSQDVKNLLLRDELLNVQLLFSTPAGKGLNCIIEHKKHYPDYITYFMGIADYLKCTYDLEADPYGMDICYPTRLGFDKHAWIHPHYL